MLPVSNCQLPQSDCPLSHGLCISLSRCPLPDSPSVPLFIVPSSAAPPSHGLIVRLSIVSLSAVRVSNVQVSQCPIVKCPIAPWSHGSLSHSPLSCCPTVHCPSVHCPTVRLPPVAMSHCCIALPRRGLQARVRRGHFRVNQSSRGIIWASVSHAELDNRQAFKENAPAGNQQPDRSYMSTLKLAAPDSYTNVLRLISKCYTGTCQNLKLYDSISPCIGDENTICSCRCQRMMTVHSITHTITLGNTDTLIMV